MAKQLELATFWGQHRSNSSKIQSHFGLHKNETGGIKDRTVAVCKYCNAELKYQREVHHNFSIITIIFIY